MTPGNKFVELDKKVHDRSNFSCGVEVLDKFIRSDASKHRELKISRTMVLPAREPVAPANLYPIAAFYTTTQTTIERQSVTAKLAKSLPNYPVPVFTIPCLAVDKELQGRGLGSDTLTVALTELYHASKNGISGIGVVIDPLDERADAIYRNFGFETLTEKRLFLGMKTVGKIVET